MSAYTYCSLPEPCDDKDCPDDWHLATYWLERRMGKDRYTYDAYGDGDHEEVDDLPDYKEQRKAWDAYHAYCADTGTDPLGIYHQCKASVEREAQWQALFRVSIVGLVLVGVRRRGRGPWVSPEDAPARLLEYLDVEKRGQRWVYHFEGTPKESLSDLRMHATRDPLVTVQASGEGAVKLKCKIVESRDRSGTKAYAHEVRKIARASLVHHSPGD